MKQQNQPVTSEPEKIWNHTFISIFIANMMMHLGQQMMNTLISKYAHSLGAAATVVGLVTSMFAYTAIIFKIFAAPAIDTFNKKYILTGSIFVMAVSYAGYAMSTSIQMLMVFRLLQGAGQAFTATCCLAMASSALPRSKMGTGIGYFSLAQAMCQAIGPTVGLSLAGWVGFPYTFAIGAAVMLAAAYFASRIKLKHKREKPFTLSIRNVVAREAILPACIMFFLTGVYCNINSFLVIYAGERGVTGGIGSFFTVYALTLLFTRPMIGKLSDRYGLTRVLIPAVFCFAAAFMIISVADSLPLFLLAAFVSAFGYGASQPAVQTLSMKSVVPERRGAASSTNYIGQDLGQLVGPVVAGTMIERAGYSLMWRYMLIPLGMVILVVVVFRKKINGE